MSTTPSPSHPAFDTVHLEDVLAARVLRKAIGAAVVVLGFIGVVLGYFIYDVSRAREALETDRAALAKQAKDLETDMAAMRREYEDKKGELLRDMGLSAGLVDGARQYQDELARHLVELGAKREAVERLEGSIRGAADDVERRVRAADSLERARAARLREDAETLARFQEDVRREVHGALNASRAANHLVLNRWSQVVEEEQRTPIADSHFWVRFDDIQENRLTGVALWYHDGRADREVPVAERLVIGDSVPVPFGGERYVLIPQAQFRDRGRVLGMGHTDRVVFRLDRLERDSVAGGTRAALGSP
jgi:hypothetical protein